MVTQQLWIEADAEADVKAEADVEAEAEADAEAEAAVASLNKWDPKRRLHFLVRQ